MSDSIVDLFTSLHKSEGDKKSKKKLELLEELCLGQKEEITKLQGVVIRLEKKHEGEKEGLINKIALLEDQIERLKVFLA